MSKGYFGHPTVFKDQVVFVSEEDLWTVPLYGGIPRRLTTGLGALTAPAFSPDGRWIAFSTEEEGHQEIALIEAMGGTSRRLTYLGANSHVAGWTPRGEVLISSTFQAHHRMPELYTVPVTGGLPQPLRLGPSFYANMSESGQIVMERSSHRPEPAHWKRYRGGTAGTLWIGDSIDSEFKPLIELDSNLARPMFVGDRIYFISDHEGIGNIYSCRHNGTDLKRHTHGKDFYARNPRTDGRTIVYHAGGEIFALDIASDKVKKVDIIYKSQRTQRARKFVSSARYLEHCDLHPQGHKITVTSRGQAFSMGNWEGPVIRHGTKSGVRYRQADWLFDSAQMVVVSDDGGEECLEIYDESQITPKKVFNHPGIGRVVRLKASPKKTLVGIVNHRNELVIADLENDTVKIVDCSKFALMGSFDWSPDGEWLVYSTTVTKRTSHLKIYNVSTAESRDLTKPFLWDFSPSFSPDGKYIYFLSNRVIDPVYDSIQWEASFPASTIPCAVTLKKELRSPFMPETKVPAENKKDNKDEKKNDKDIKVDIDFEGIFDRVLAFPVQHGRYLQLEAAGEKVLWMKGPVRGALQGPGWGSSEPEAVNTLEAFDFESQKAETLLSSMTGFKVSRDGKQMLLQIGRSLRVCKAGEKVPDKFDRDQCDRKSGWINLSRVKVLVEPAMEWQQMLREVWRLQRDHFWVETMSNVDWATVLERYLPLVEKVNCRKEFSDLVWEMQGELGTSHAYDMGGDYRDRPHYQIGKLGADFTFDRETGGYKIHRLLKGDSWNAFEAVPLKQPGVLVKEGDVLVAINGVSLSEEITPYQQLMNLAGHEVMISVLHEGKGEPKNYVVKTLSDENATRYRDWVEKNRAYVHEVSGGKMGYVHIPDMGPFGFAEFHRLYLQEYDYDGLVIDVRYNGGGSVSQLLLEKLSRQRLGMVKTRWFGESPKPEESPAGPMVALTNEFAGSDGDIFSHTFKMKKLGPLIGKRTWGGVIGIWPRHRLVDGSMTTQPEFSHWFSDVGWKVENYGTDPTTEVEYPPHDYRRGRDPQLDVAVRELTKIMEVKPPFRPKVVEYPDLRPPEMSV